MKIHTPRDVAALQDELITRLAKERLEAFLESVWPILQPDTPYQSNWHLFVSHSETLAILHSLDRRRLIQDDWFRQRFRTVRLASDQRTKTEFHNTRRGSMLATSMGGSITGKGGDRLVIDDPHSPEQAESDLQRQHALDRFRMTLSTRLDDKTNGAIIVVMQRLHTQDLSGLCLDLGFHHLCLEALPSNRTTLVFPRSAREIVREAEEPLWPAREGRQALEELRRILGTYAFEGQYQQRPVPRSGGYFQREWWSFFDELPTGRNLRIMQSWDLTFKDGDGSDFVVGLVVAHVGATVYILDRFRAKLGFVDTVRAIKAMVAKYPTTSAVLIEDAANGPAVVDTLKRDIRGLIAVSPEGGKQSRANAVQAQCEARQVFLPRPTTPAGEPRVDRAWVEDFITILAAFPKGPHDDDVDALTQALVWLSQHQSFGPCFAVRQPEPFFKPRFGMFRTSFAPRHHLSATRLSDWIYGRRTHLGPDDDDDKDDDDDDDEGGPGGLTGNSGSVLGAFPYRPDGW